MFAVVGADGEGGGLEVEMEEEEEEPAVPSFEEADIEQLRQVLAAGTSVEEHGPAGSEEDSIKFMRTLHLFDAVGGECMFRLLMLVFRAPSPS